MTKTWDKIALWFCLFACLYFLGCAGKGYYKHVGYQEGFSAGYAEALEACQGPLMGENDETYD